MVSIGKMRGRVETILTFYAPAAVKLRINYIETLLIGRNDVFLLFTTAPVPQPISEHSTGRRLELYTLANTFTQLGTITYLTRVQRLYYAKRESLLVSPHLHLSEYL